jgi:hypothetical protein
LALVALSQALKLGCIIIVDLLLELIFSGLGAVLLETGSVAGAAQSGFAEC